MKNRLGDYIVAQQRRWNRRRRDTPWSVCIHRRLNYHISYQRCGMLAEIPNTFLVFSSVFSVKSSTMFLINITGVFQRFLMVFRQWNIKKKIISFCLLPTICCKYSSSISFKNNNLIQCRYVKITKLRYFQIYEDLYLNTFNKYQLSWNIGHYISKNSLGKEKSIDALMVWYIINNIQINSPSLLKNKNCSWLFVCSGSKYYLWNLLK